MNFSLLKGAIFTIVFRTNLAIWRIVIIIPYFAFTVIFFVSCTRTRTLRKTVFRFILARMAFIITRGALGHPYIEKSFFAVTIRCIRVSCIIRALSTLIFTIFAAQTSIMTTYKKNIDKLFLINIIISLILIYSIKF